MKLMPMVSTRISSSEPRKYQFSNISNKTSHDNVTEAEFQDMINKVNADV